MCVDTPKDGAQVLPPQCEPVEAVREPEREERGEVVTVNDTMIDLRTGQRPAGSVRTPGIPVGPAVVSLLDRARELRQSDNRHLELLGERLERARYFRDLGGAVLPLRARRHELQVVDDHQAELRVLALQPPRARAHFERIERRRVIYVDLSLM